MKMKYRTRSSPRNIILLCVTCSAFSFGFFCGVLSNYWSDAFSNDKDSSGNWQPSIDRSGKSVSIRTSMIVVILSGPSNYLQRKIIRKTWLQTTEEKPIRHLFIVGMASLDLKEIDNLNKEQQLNYDLLLLEDFKDSYRSLSVKVLRAFSWIADNVDFTFLLKVDDDSFVRLSDLYSSLSLRNQTAKLYLGFFDGRARIKKRGHWAESNWFLCDRYLPYAQGGGYVLTADLVKYVAKNRDVLTLYNSEDVSLGVWLAPVKMARVHDNNFDTEYQSRGCFNSYLVTHKQSPQQMIDKYNNLLKHGRMCESEFRKKKSYVYNWNTLPSLCCHRNNTLVP